MKAWHGYIAGTVVTAGILIAVYFLFLQCDGKPGITDETPVKENVVIQPTNYDEYTKCFYASMFIKTTFIDDEWLDILAGNYCKTAEKKIKLRVPEKERKTTLEFGVPIFFGFNREMKKFDVLPGVEFGFIRWHGRVGWGLRGTYIHGVVIDQQYGAITGHVDFSF